MKRWISFLLTPMLLLGLACPAAAAEEDSASARLTRVTQTVRNTLDLDTELYDSFRGESYEQELGTVWSLNWNGSGMSLSVEALEDGTVLNYWRNDGDQSGYIWRGNALPTIPKVDKAAAKAAAEAFLDRVLDSATESVELSTPEDRSSLGSSSCNFSGTILLNSLPSPLNYSITVRGSDNQVTGFNRDAAAQSYLNGVPAASPAVSVADAAKTLREVQELELIYVLADSADAKNAKDTRPRAVLRYVPTGDRNAAVDAQTGELVHPTDAVLFGRNEYASASMDAGGTGASREAEKQLSEAELEGIEKLEGVLSSAELDQAVRAERAYQLDAFTLSGSQYRVTESARGVEEVLATLTYTRAQGSRNATRVFTVDARSGAVKGLYGYQWDGDSDRPSSVSTAKAQATAEEFLQRFTDHAGELELRETEAPDTDSGMSAYRFTFARRLNGYFFPEQACVIGIDRMSGAVTSLTFTYDETVEADAPEGLVSAEQALDAWMDAHTVTLAYRGLSQELNPADPQQARLIDRGMTSFRKLFLSYGLERELRCSGIDAKTGKPVETPRESQRYDYTDVAGHWASREIEALASCQVGYDGGVFRPNLVLTQWDLVCLLASAQGLRLNPETATPEERDNAYSAVYRMGGLTRAQRSDSAAVDRMTLVRILLDSAGFAEVAKLEGIFSCTYPDAAAIEASHLGYAALAQGFGMVRGAYAPKDPATRAVAAAMLYRLMSR